MHGDYDLVMKIARDFRSAGLDEEDLAMLEYAEKITVHGEEIDQADIEKLRRAGWTEREILDIAALTCYRIFISRMADALGVELTEDYRNLRHDYVQSLMVGKKLL